MVHPSSVQKGFRSVTPKKAGSKACIFKPSSVVRMLELSKSCYPITVVSLGHTEDWASPKDQRAWFADISGAIIG